MHPSSVDTSNEHNSRVRLGAGRPQLRLPDAANKLRMLRGTIGKGAGDSTPGGGQRMPLQLIVQAEFSAAFSLDWKGERGKYPSSGIREGENERAKRKGGARGAVFRGRSLGSQE